ncbi:MAG: hypothetical protein M3Q76_12110, partial [Acidobacteriota bacterium]|nr:hypothetical protein [Acidobacteriota bacterium]
ILAATEGAQQRLIDALYRLPEKELATEDTENSEGKALRLIISALPVCSLAQNIIGNPIACDL